MPTDIRIATFNVENLFDRARVLNLDDPAEGDAALADIAALQRELRKAAYDKSQILALWGRVKEYVEVVETREKLFNRYRTKVLAGGRADWAGWIQFKRDTFSDAARSNTARVIRAVGADVVCLIEVESRPTLQRFAAEKLTGTHKYPHNMLIDGNDDRGIDVAVLSRLEIRRLRSHMDDRDGTSRIFSRDCLEAQIHHSAGFDLWLLVNHFKSKGYGPAAVGNARRRRQAERVAEILRKGYDLKKQRVVVAGDFNDTPGSQPLAPLLGVPDLHDALALQYPAAADRWTYHYNGSGQQIDYLLVSKPLKEAFQAAGVERKGIHGVAGVTPFSTVTGPTSSASDHGAVWAKFRV